MPLNYIPRTHTISHGAGGGKKIGEEKAGDFVSLASAVKEKKGIKNIVKNCFDVSPALTHMLGWGPERGSGKKRREKNLI